MLDRRRLLTIGGLTLGGVAGGAMLVPTGPETAAASPGNGHGPHPVPGPIATPNTAQVAPKVAPFTTRMPVPRELRPARSVSGVDVYRIPVKPATVELVPGVGSAVRTYDGTFVGPTIRARRGRPVRVTYTNQLDRPTNVHLHGGHVPPVSDGHPMETIAPGQSRTYDYANNQRGATLWYHDHSHGTEAENVYFGLHGMYLIEDDDERHLGLPSGQYDVPIMLSDVQLDANGGLVFLHPVDRTTVLANGRQQPYFPVAARKYRFRLVNGANERIFRLTIGGVELTQIASDGGLLPEPVRRSEIVLGSAERAEVVVDFSKHPVGSQVVLYDVTGPVLRFDVVREAADRSRVPARLRPLPAMPVATVERDVTLTFDLTGELPVGLVNGKPYDPARADFRIKRGSTEIWRITNGDTEIGIPHTFHLHLEQFRVLDRDGLPPNQDDHGLKDTVFVPPGQTVRIQATFTEFLGTYVYHCHFLEHSSLGMMAQMEIVP